VAKVDEHVRPAHEVCVEITGPITGLPGEHDRHVVVDNFAEIIGNRGAASLEAFGELEADLFGVPFLDIVDNAFKLVIPLAVVAEIHPRVPEVALGVAIVTSVVAHCRFFPPEPYNRGVMPELSRSCRKECNHIRFHIDRVHRGRA
jgi:hypothetical protein